MIVWREKLVAFAVHFLLTLIVAVGAAILIFRVWFPVPFQAMSGGTQLFVLIVGCDLALGPLISLVIYNSRKTRRSLVIDYSIVAFIQLAGIVYGVYAISHWRPAYIVYAVDRLEVVTAGEVAAADLNVAPKPYDTLPAWGPKLVAIRLPEDAKSRNKALFDALAGKDVALVPAYYVAYETQLPQIKAHAKTLQELESTHPRAQGMIDRAVQSAGMAPERLRWLPIKSRTGYWTALIDADSGRPRAYFPFDPY